MIIEILVPDHRILWGFWGKGQIFRWVLLRAVQGGVLGCCIFTSGCHFVHGKSFVMDFWVNIVKSSM